MHSCSLSAPTVLGPWRGRTGSSKDPYPRPCSPVSSAQSSSSPTTDNGDRRGRVFRPQTPALLDSAELDARHGGRGLMLASARSLAASAEFAAEAFAHQEAGVVEVKNFHVRTGLSLRTIRNYDEVGLLPGTARTEGSQGVLGR